MKLAILSDIHDNVWNLAVALQHISQQADISSLLCCGDLCSPFVVNMLSEGFPGQIRLIKGNNDGDLRLITLNAAKYSHVQVAGEFTEFELGGKRMCANHYPDIATAIASSGVYDLVFYGHNHAHRIEMIGKTLLLNPGTLMGWSPLKPPGERDIPATFVVYDPRDEGIQTWQISNGGVTLL